MRIVTEYLVRTNCDSHTVHRFLATIYLRVIIIVWLQHYKLIPSDNQVALYICHVLLNLLGERKQFCGGWERGGSPHPANKARGRTPTESTFQVAFTLHKEASNNLWTECPMLKHSPSSKCLCKACPQIPLDNNCHFLWTAHFYSRDINRYINSFKK